MRKLTTDASGATRILIKAVTSNGPACHQPVISKHALRAMFTGYLSPCRTCHLPGSLASGFDQGGTPEGCHALARLEVVIAVKAFGWLVVVSLVVIRQSPGFAAETNSAPYGQWKNGPPSDPNYFPIAVWVQNPRN